jgi:hypothetical protein
LETDMVFALVICSWLLQTSEVALRKC